MICWIFCFQTIILSVVLGSPLDDVNGAIKQKNGCFFPFMYNGTIHNDCIFNGNTREGSWCSLTNNYDRDGRKQPCWENGETLKIVESNLPCKFPFKALWKSFDTCVTSYNPDNGRFGMCSVTGNMNIDKTMRWCTQFDWPTNSQLQTINPDGCVFPFMYQREVQNDCVFETVNNTRTSWCSLTNNYDRDRERRECWGNEEHKSIEDDPVVPCVFPFKYKEETFHSCSNILYESEHGQCGTSENMNTERRFKKCTVFDDPKTPGVPYPTGCVFPFLYERIIRNDCIFEDGDGEGWCSRTNNYDRDERKIRCWKDDEITEELGSQPCVFPFIFKNTTYDSCNFLWDDVFPEHGYCGTTSNINVDRRFKACSYFDKIVTKSTSGYSECVFPFLYEQIELNECIFDESNDSGWCSGTNNYDRDQIKKPCWKTTDDETVKDTAFVPCSFPFQYQDKMYNQCIHMFGETPYGQCGTTSSINVDRKYKDCTYFDEPRGVPRLNGCIFPFLYQGEPQNTCVYTNDEPGWCSTTNNYDRDGEKIICWEEGAQVTESSEFSPCFFPFTYKNETYEKCTDIVSSSEHGQCATRSNDINISRAYRNCTRFDPISLNTVVENHDVPCHFPFIFKNKVYNECAPLIQDTKYGQCSTTANMDVDGKYRNCTNAIGCHFPFVYRNKIHNDCIFPNFHRGWCSITDNYDRDGLKKRCFAEGIDKWIEEEPNTPCHFPYRYRNRVVDRCINHLLGSRRFICATTPNFNRDRRFKYCNQEEVDATVAIPTDYNNKTCVFPFEFEGNMFYGCTSAYLIENRLWCGVGGDDGHWGHCLQIPNKDLIIVDRGMDTYLGKRCIFPFKYRGKWFHGCITLHHQDKRFWCATTQRHVGDEVEYDDFDLCVVEENTVITTFGGTGKGAKCHFPFVENINGEGTVWNNGCISKNDTWGYWCATTFNFTADKLWGYCNIKNTDTQLKDIDANRRAVHGKSIEKEILKGHCHFPYNFYGETYHGCMQADIPVHYMLCATAENYSTDDWAKCTSDDVIRFPSRWKEDGGVSTRCTFPFVYEKKLHSSLMVNPRTGIQNFCSTTANYDRDQLGMPYCDE